MTLTILASLLLFSLTVKAAGGRTDSKEWPSPAGPSGLVKAGKTDAKSTAKIGTLVPLANPSVDSRSLPERVEHGAQGDPATSPLWLDETLTRSESDYWHRVAVKRTTWKESAYTVGGVRGNGAAPQTTKGNRLAFAGDQAGTSAAGHSAMSTNYWHRVAVKRLHLLGKRERRIVALLVRIHKLKRGLSGEAASAKTRPPRFSIPHYSDWLCIHSREGSWTDSGDPYWGGLQMDRSFMSTYAPAWLLRKGLANVWTPLQQMWVAERAWRTRGFSPWPNTARACGLL